MSTREEGKKFNTKVVKGSPRFTKHFSSLSTGDIANMVLAEEELNVLFFAI